MDKREEIFLSVLESHKGIIYKVANTYCQDKTDREDLIQEITILVWRSIEKFNDQFKWSTWIYRIALNTSISFYRKNKTHRERTVDLDQIIQVPSSVDEAPQDENFILLRQFIRELKEIDRALILLHLEGLSTQEIAHIIAISQTNVTTKISRIKKTLKLKFQNHKK